MTKLRWTDPAVADLQAIKDYISQDSEESAISLLEKIIAAPERLIQFPEIGRIVPESENQRIREIIAVRNYRVIYLWEEPFIYILGIIHVRQSLAEMDPKPWSR